MLTFTSLLVTCLLVLVVSWGWLRWRHRRLIRAANKMEGMFPTCYPILGHIPYLVLGMERAAKRCLSRSVELLARGSVTACAWIGPFPFPVIAGVENVQKVLNSSCSSEKGDMMSVFECFFGYGLLNAPGSIWKTKRQHINPLFQPHNLEHMIPTFNQNSKELVEILSKHVGKGPFNVMDPIMDTALKTICHLIFGPDIEFDMTSRRFKGLRKVIERILEICVTRMMRVWLRVDIIFQYLYKNELDEINKLWQEFTETPLKIAKRKHKEKLNNSVQDENEHETTGTAADNSRGLLNLLDVHSVLEMQFPQFDETDLKNEMITLYVTGSDTIAGSLSSCLLVLAHHQEIQERLYREIASVDGDVTLADIQNLTYLDQVCKENLRWAMIVPFVTRKTTKDLKLNTVTIPAGYTIIVALAANSWDPNVFPDPHLFDPERFSSKNMTERARYSFQPFSGGSRNSIGQHYTNMFMKVLLVHILKRYKFSTKMDVFNLRKKIMITLVSVEGYQVILENR